MKHLTLSAAMALALLLALVPHAAATSYTISHVNSSATVCVNDCALPGMTDWIVDGRDQLYQQWFWYRIGPEGGEQSIDALPFYGSELDNGTFKSTLDVAYGTLDTFLVTITYTLAGGELGTHWSDIGEVITIRNFGSTALDFHLFQYSDFDLDQTIGGQTVHITDGGGNPTATQTSATGSYLSESTIGPPQPNRYEANLYPATWLALNDGSPTNLNNEADAGPGDATWAFQWDFTVAANGGTQGVSKDKQIRAAVPEPAPVLLLGGVLVVLARKLRRAVL